MIKQLLIFKTIILIQIIEKTSKFLKRKANLKFSKKQENY
jgi:hypothetical protein